VTGARPRPRPCPACPYRAGAPSGLWAPEEYDKLPAYDGTTTDQAAAGAFAPFYCHAAPEAICAGWAGCHDMGESLAARLGVATGAVDASVFTYATAVPLFPDGAAAAQHGKRDVYAPGARARAAAAALARAHPRLRRRAAGS
jgi:hypothetical protein